MSEGNPAMGACFRRFQGLSGGRPARALALCLMLAACGGNSEPDLESQSAKAIFDQAEFQLEARDNPEEAASLFAEVERLYPYSEWAKRAVIMEAFAYQQARKFPESRAAARRYIDFYPADEDAAYAQYLIALSYYDQIELVGRDQELTFNALQELRTVFERYPGSDYAATARLKFDLAFDRLAAKEMEVGRYYLKRGNHTAAINRFRNVVEDFKTSTQTPEALYRLIEANLALGLDAEAQTAGAILGFNYRGSEWYEDGFALLQGAELEPGALGTGWLRDIYRQMIQGKWL